MRRIKFRGKSKENNEWVEGYYGYKDLTDEHFIIVPTFDSYGSGSRLQYFTDNLVENETVSEYINVNDAKGKGIYENDIVRYRGFVCSVKWQPIECRFSLVKASGFEIYKSDYTDFTKCEVIGNIFDDKNLLEI